MSKPKHHSPKPRPITRTDVTRIVRAETNKNGGQIAADSFAARADRVVQQREVAVAKPLAPPARKP